MPVSAPTRIRLFASVNVATSGDTAIVAAVAGKRIRILAYTLISAGICSVKWRSATTDLTGAMPFVANSGVAVNAEPQVQTAVAEALNLNLSANVAITGHVTYTLV